MAPRKVWPFGHATETCAHCGGAGMSKIKADQHAGTRKPSDTQTLKNMKCGYCDGRGRVIVGTTTDRTCNHGLKFEDCALCRPYAPAATIGGS